MRTEDDGRAMNPPKHLPRKPVRRPATTQAERHASMREAVMLSLIVAPNGGFAQRRHGQGAMRRAS
jgi:hypothetical protein